VLLHAFHWYINKQLDDELGRLPALFDEYLVNPDRPKGVPTFHITVNLGWTLDERYGAQTATKGEGSPDHDEMNDIMGRAFLRLVASCLSFMEQRITIPVSRPTSRAAPPSGTDTRHIPNQPPRCRSSNFADASAASRSTPTTVRTHIRASGTCSGSWQGTGNS
jgi:hypothetical protein